MMDQLGNEAEQSHVVVLAGSALRSAPLEALAESLRGQGNRVEVVAGVDRRRVELLKLSFRHRGRASYLLLGGPALRAEVLRSIATELEANGVPAPRISAGPVTWEDAVGVLRQATERLEAMGEPAPMVNTGPIPPTPHLPPPRQPLPSMSVPVVSASSTMTAGRIPTVSRPAWAVAGVAALGVLAFAISAFTSSEDAAADSGTTAVASVGSPFAAEPDPIAAPEARGEDDDEAFEAEALDAASEVVPPAEPAPEGGSLAELIDDEDVDPPVELPEDDAELVYAALSNQEIRAIDILLVSPPKMKQRGRRSLIAKANFEDARDYCRSLEVEGVVGWRLPSVGEAQWLSRSNMIRTGVYWTATKADAFGRERVTWNARSKRMRSSGLRWRGGRTVCVRFSKPEDGPG